ncbi:MAG: hypothetical protein BYD32DRAFT_414745 [Podila humilis]|nr:MAG: hypothetical protein BYD32DRAFT_414745 [Podila humilis]
MYYPFGLFFWFFLLVLSFFLSLILPNEAAHGWSPLCDGRSGTMSTRPLFVLCFFSLALVSAQGWTKMQGKRRGRKGISLVVSSFLRWGRGACACRDGRQYQFFLLLLVLLLFVVDLLVSSFSTYSPLSFHAKSPAEILVQPFCIRTPSKQPQHNRITDKVVRNRSKALDHKGRKRGGLGLTYGI